ncbi:MAG: FecR domain-containing protein [Verrucomicrobia bacterium]|nr:FecR domain-containing protein [Verrucomicrobiota bacterium]
MKKLNLLLLGLLCPVQLWAAQALKESIFTQVLKDVKVVSRATQAATPVKVTDVFQAPDLIRTGPDSLAELIAADKTITRVGANTVFSFEPAGRAMNLEQGSVLFHSPKGKGGGTIRSKGASAAVLGTTIVVTATVGGGFKAIVLEGRGQITLPNGNFRILQAGQVTFVLPGAQRFGPQLNINLGKLVESSRLVQGFETELPSKPVIQAAIERQLVLIRTGLADDTNLIVGNQATENTVETVNTSVLERVVEVREDRLATAKATDVVIRTPNLNDHPNHVFLDPIPFDIPALGVLNFSGFVGKDVTVAPTVSQIDFTPFLNQTDFVIGAAKTLTLQSAMLQLYATRSVGGPSALQKVTLAGKSGITIAPNASITASHIGELHLVTDETMSLNSVNIANSGDKLRLYAGQLLDLSGGFYNVSAGNGTLQLSSGSDVTVNNSAQFQANTVNMSAARNATLNSAVIRGFTTLNVSAIQNMTVASGSFTGASASPTITSSFSAGDTLIVNNSSFANVADISLSARTVNLSNIDFPNGSTVTLYSQNGLLADKPNTGAASVPGHVNFILNVNYNGNPAQLFVGGNITIGVRP